MHCTPPLILPMLIIIADFSSEPHMVSNVVFQVSVYSLSLDEIFCADDFLQKSYVPKIDRKIHIQKILWQGTSNTCILINSFLGTVENSRCL